MQCYFAPMEGITGYIYRRAFHEYFGDAIDKYFTPFLSPGRNTTLTPREKNDILPEHNKGLRLVPQILTNCAEDFIKTAEALAQFGYEEVNLNLGCPSGTVTAKQKGAGFLALPEALDCFLEEIYSKVKIQISIKTRIGTDCPEEFPRLLEIYNQYPVSELIIHPRIQKDYYKNTPNLKVFETALRDSKNPVCYNGDIFTAADYKKITDLFPQVKTVMLGRGLIANPGLAKEIKGGAAAENTQLKAFHDQVYADYRTVLSGDRSVLFKMKELWFYMAPKFSDSRQYLKKIKKAENCKAYEQVVERLFAEQQFLPHAAKQ